MAGMLKLALVAPIVLGAQAVQWAAHSQRSLRASPANVTVVNATIPVAGIQGERNAPPCQCEVSNPAWVKPTRTDTKCVFIDLGAANGNTFQSFLANGYGPVANCPGGGKWHAILVEANPRFNDALTAVQTQYGVANVESLGAHAAYACEGQTSFYLDTVTHEHNYWGSSMSSNAGDVINSGKQKVTVPTVNLNRLLWENTIPGDYVLVKMDIEGAEWDVVPCVAHSPSATLMDSLYMEVHGANLGLIGTTEAQFQQAKAQLQQQGVNIPDYWTPHSM